MNENTEFAQCTHLRSITVWQEGEATGSQKGAQSLEEFVDLLQSIMELGRQINGLQRPADLPPPGQGLPLDIELESEVCSRSVSFKQVCHTRSP